MARLTIDLGTAGNSATGDSVRGAFNKVNQNFEEIYNELGADGTFSNIGFSGNSIISDDTNGDIILDPNGSGSIVVDATISNRSTNANIVISPNGTGSLDVDTSRIINVTDPTSAQDAATKAYVDAQNQSQALTFVGDDSTGTAVNSGETFKIAGTQNITTAVSGDTLTITGPDLTNYLQNTGTQTIDNLSFNDNIISTSSNANLVLDAGGTGKVTTTAQFEPNLFRAPRFNGDANANSAYGSKVGGEIYYDTGINHLKVWNGSIWYSLM